MDWILIFRFLTPRTVNNQDCSKEQTCCMLWEESSLELQLMIFILHFKLPKMQLSIFLLHMLSNFNCILIERDSWYSKVGLVSSLQVGRCRVHVLAGTKLFLSPKRSASYSVSTKSSFSWVTWAGLEADDSPPLSTKVRNK
jgi:hypothetical protein